jgi:hypothetical protein
VEPNGDCAGCDAPKEKPPPAKTKFGNASSAKSNTCASLQGYYENKLLYQSSRLPPKPNDIFPTCDACFLFAYVLSRLQDHMEANIMGQKEQIQILWLSGIWRNFSAMVPRLKPAFSRSMPSHPVLLWQYPGILNLQCRRLTDPGSGTRTFIDLL